MNEKVKVIKSTKLARELLKGGFRILDIKPHRYNKDRTVFIFEDSGIMEWVERSGLKYLLLEE